MKKVINISAEFSTQAFHGVFSGIPPGHLLGDSAAYMAMMERLSAERMSAERMSAERLQVEQRMAMQDPMIRLQMSGMAGSAAAAAAAAAAAQQHAHTHTHAHSHTHLHLHQPDMPGMPGGPPPPPGLPPTSSGIPHHFLPPHLLHSLPGGKHRPQFIPSCRC